MKKDKYIIAKVALATYFFVMGTVLVLNNWAEKARIHNELLKVEMSVDELKYYVNEDIFSGNLREDLHEYYNKELHKIEKSIKKLKDE